MSMDEEYGNYNDEELILRLRDGEESITEYLMKNQKYTLQDLEYGEKT